MLGESDYELLRHLSDGAGNREIAQVLNKSEFTVRNQLSHLYRKIKVTNRARAAVWFTENAPQQRALSTPRKTRRTLENPLE